MAIYTVDRIEGEIAVLLLNTDETIIKEVSMKDFKTGVKEGDLLEITFDSNGSTILQVAPLESETEQAKKKANALLQKILSKNKKQ